MRSSVPASTSCFTSNPALVTHWLLQSRPTRKPESNWAIRASSSIHRGRQSHDSLSLNPTPFTYRGTLLQNCSFSTTPRAYRQRRRSQGLLPGSDCANQLLSELNRLAFRPVAEWLQRLTNTGSMGDLLATEIQGGCRNHERCRLWHRQPAQKWLVPRAWHVSRHQG